MFDWLLTVFGSLYLVDYILEMLVALQGFWASKNGMICRGRFLNGLNQTRKHWCFPDLHFGMREQVLTRCEERVVFFMRWAAVFNMYWKRQKIMFFLPKNARPGVIWNRNMHAMLGTLYTLKSIQLACRIARTIWLTTTRQGPKQRLKLSRQRSRFQLNSCHWNFQWKWKSFFLLITTECRCVVHLEIPPWCYWAVWSEMKCIFMLQ